MDALNDDNTAETNDTTGPRLGRKPHPHPHPTAPPSAHPDVACEILTSQGIFFQHTRVKSAGGRDNAPTHAEGIFSATKLMRDLKVLQVDQLFPINSLQVQTTIPECVGVFILSPKRRRGRALTAGGDNPPKIEEDSARDGQEVEEEESRKTANK